MREYVPSGVIPAVLLPFHEDLSIDEGSYRAHLRDVGAVQGLSAITVNAHASEVASCTFDESLVTQVRIEELPPSWRDPRSAELRDFGDEWIRSERSAVLSVPSVIVDHERNYLLNPLHEDFKRIELSPPKPFRFDLRLVS